MSLNDITRIELTDDGDGTNSVIIEFADHTRWGKNVYLPDMGSVEWKREGDKLVEHSHEYDPEDI